MSKKWWLNFLFVLAIVVLTNLLSNTLNFKLVSNFYNKKIEDYLSFLNSEKDQKDGFEFSKKDGQIHTGVVIPENLVANNNEKDCNHAKTFLSKKNGWLHITTKRLQGHCVFVFRALANDENLANK